MKYGNLLFGDTSLSHHIRRLLFGVGPNDTPPSPADLAYFRFQIENSEATARIVAAKSKFPGLQLDSPIYEPSSSQTTNTNNSRQQELQDGLSNSLLAVAKHLKFPESTKLVSNLGLTILLALHGETNDRPTHTRLSALLEDLRAFPIRKSILEHAIHRCIERKKSKITVAMAQEARDHVLCIRQTTPLNPSPSQKYVPKVRQAPSAGGGHTLRKPTLGGRVPKHASQLQNRLQIGSRSAPFMVTPTQRDSLTTPSMMFCKPSQFEYPFLSTRCPVFRTKVAQTIACEARDHVLTNRRRSPPSINPSTSQSHTNTTTWHQELVDSLSESLLSVDKYLKMPVNPTIVSKLGLTTLLALRPIGSRFARLRHSDAPTTFSTLPDLYLMDVEQNPLTVPLLLT